MKQDYFNYLEHIIYFKNYLKKLKEETEVILEAIEENKNNCLHELLITFGEIEDTRVFGLMQKYYCPFCSHVIRNSIKDNKLKDKTIVDLKNYNFQNNSNLVFINIQNKLYEYFKDHKDAGILEIKDYIESLNLYETTNNDKKIKIH